MKKEKHGLEVNLSGIKSDANAVVYNYKATILNADLSFLKKDAYNGYQRCIKKCIVKE